MAKLLIQTQVYENYGDADKPYWKAKGGSDYVVKKVNVNKITETVMGVRSQIECDNYAFRESIIDWTIVADDALIPWAIRRSIRASTRVTAFVIRVSVAFVAATT